MTRERLGHQSVAASIGLEHYANGKMLAESGTR